MIATLKWQYYFYILGKTYSNYFYSVSSAEVMATTKSIEEMIYDYEDDKNSMRAISEKGIHYL